RQYRYARRLHISPKRRAESRAVHAGAAGASFPFETKPWGKCTEPLEWSVRMGRDCVARREPASPAARAGFARGRSACGAAAPSGRVTSYAVSRARSALLPPNEVRLEPRREAPLKPRAEG